MVFLLPPKDSEKQILSLLEEYGNCFDASTFDWGMVNKCGLHNRCIKNQLERQLTCGKILQHAQDQITNFREQIGIRVCVFKIGVTSNPRQRYASYVGKGYTRMHLISVSQSADLTQMLEAALVSQFSAHVGCRTAAGTGGEGALNRPIPPPPPYFVYIVGARADQRRSIL